MSVQKINPLKKAYDTVDILSKSLKDKMADLYINLNSPAYEERLKQEIEQIRAELELANINLQLTESFFNRYVELKQSGDTDEVDRLRKEMAFDYFFRELDPAFFKAALKGEPCDECGKTRTIRTGVVVTFDPLTNELKTLCSNCHIDRMQLAQKQRKA